MQIQVEDSANEQLLDIYYYFYQYSIKSAIKTSESILNTIGELQYAPYIGKSIEKIPNKYFRELILKITHNSYRIVYYISEKTNTIYIVHISNCKQDFNRILRTHNYFRNYYDL